MQSRDGAIHTNVDPSYFLPYNTYCHKIIKRKNGKYVKVVVDNLANFLSISPNQIKFFLSIACSQLDISATWDSVSAVCEGYQFHYCWI